MDKAERIYVFKDAYGKVISDEIIAWLDEHGYFDAPASSHYHGAYQGGLVDHCINVTDKLLEYTESLSLKWSRPESPYYIGLFHDLCKMDEYEQAELGYKRVKNDSLELLGHGDKSVMKIAEILTLTEEEIYCIRYHMGAYETDKWKQYDLAIQKYPNVLYTHTADMYASKLLDGNGLEITYKQIIEEFYKTGKEPSEYESFRQSYLDQGFVIINEDSESK